MSESRSPFDWLRRIASWKVTSDVVIYCSALHVPIGIRYVVNDDGIRCKVVGTLGRPPVIARRFRASNRDGERARSALVRASDARLRIRVLPPAAPRTRLVQAK